MDLSPVSIVLNLASSLAAATDFGQVFFDLKSIAKSIGATSETIILPVSKTIGLDTIKAASDAMEHERNLKPFLKNILRYMNRLLMPLIWEKVNR